MMGNNSRFKKKRKITKTRKRYNIYVIRQQKYNSFTKKKTYFDGHLEVYDAFSRQTFNQGPVSQWSRKVFSPGKLW